MTYNERRTKYINEMDAGYEASTIWEEFKKDFGHAGSAVRGYGLSAIDERKRTRFQKLSRPINAFFLKIQSLVSKLRSLLLRIFSFVIFSDFIAAKKYSFDKYNDKIYDPELLKEFIEEFSSKNIGLTHHTLKTYSYLRTLKNIIGVDYFRSPKNILEIGAGMFNFGHLISQEADEFTYVICDLPEMIVSAHREITSGYIANSSGDYDVFLPTEVDGFNISESKRKVLFIEAAAYNKILDLNIEFDLFVNHESFAEMNIGVVNNYLGLVSRCVRVGGFVNIVNRYSRLQTVAAASGGEKLGNITSFNDYKLTGFKKVYQELDQFRNRIPVQREDPNVFYIGQKSN